MALKEHSFLHTLFNGLQPHDQDGPRRIIRLSSDELFGKILREWEQSRHSFPNAGSLQPLPLIRGFSLPFWNKESLMNLPGVLYVEDDSHPAEVHAVRSSSRPLIPWGVGSIKAPQTWKRTTGSRIRIGVIDTGIDFNHPDLQPVIGGGVNLISRQMLPIDDNGHGTHIAGTIAAAASGRSGIIGVAPQSTIFAIKAFDHNGTSYVTDIIQGIEWCIRNRIDIINMSFGMKTRSAALEAAVRSAGRAGVIIVASSGNEGKKGSVDYPARFAGTISVGATTRDRKIAPFTNRGKQIDIYAPGEKIYSTWLNGKYNELSGTSMATSHVSGVIALLLSLKPRLTLKQIKANLQRNSLPVNSKSTSAGFLGEISAVRSIRACLRKKASSA